MFPTAAVSSPPTADSVRGEAIPHRTPCDIGWFFGVLESVLKIEHHVDVLKWLQGDVQVVLPHTVQISAWGDFGNGPIYFDAVSPLASARTARLDDDRTRPLLQSLFERWRTNRNRAFSMPVDAGLLGLPPDSGVPGSWAVLAGTDTVLVHGIQDRRGGHNCIYALFGANLLAGDSAHDAFAMLVPYLDAALRQVRHLPQQCPPDNQAADSVRNNCADLRLSGRELEIMEWVGKGKTNLEIGMILSISPYTVKNHLQRIFRKLDVMNRAQAVARFNRAAET